MAEPSHWRSSLAQQAERSLLPFVAGALVGGGLAWLFGRPELANGLWASVTGLTAVAVAIGSYQKLRHGRLGVDLVALLALAGALGLGELLAGAVIALMVASGESLERYAHSRARRDLSALLSLAPTVAHRVGPTGVRTVGVDEINPGDLLLVKPGEVVPVDGVVERDAATLDESALTGEALPVVRQVGDVVESGSVNSAGTFRLRALATAEASAYSGIVRMVEAAAVNRAPFVRLADRYALVFVPVTLAVAATAWLASGSPTRALAVLVVATPCPLVLAAPVAIVSGISRAARRGVVVKDGGALEALANTRVLLLDKTGTLTDGRPRIVGMEVAPGASSAEVLGLAASVEQASSHVFAASVVSEAARRGIDLATPGPVIEDAGSGVRGAVGERAVAVGSEAFVLSSEPVPTWARQVRRRAEREGLNAVYIAVDGSAAGVLLLGDELRTDAPKALRALRRSGVERIVMVTGDHFAVAEPVAYGVGIDRVYADRSPAEKVAVVRSEAAAASGTAVMVGDGVNDAPALAAADLGVALGGRGATASSEAADVVLVVDRLDRLAYGVRGARRAQRIARQSVAGGMGITFVAMGFAAFGFIPPLAGALLQELIDVGAIASALRVLRRPSWDEPSEEVPDRWARQLHGDHAKLRPLLDDLRGLADSLDDLPSDEALRELRRVVDSLVRDVVAHEHIDESEIYPDVVERIGGEDPLAALSRSHREIFHLIVLLERLVEMSDREIGPTDLVDSRRVLYALDAILRLHFAQEEELLATLDPEYTVP